VKGVVLLATPGRPLKDVLRAQLLAAQVPETARTEAIRILDRILAGETVSDVPVQLAPLFRPSVQPYLASILSLDPAAELAKLTTPALIVFAGRDLQVDEANLVALAKARPEAKVVRLPEANHVLKQVPPELAANLAAYANPYLPLDPGLVPPIVEFARSVAA
jgi:pimeloyl-ACP methyl ester carboxylesterase